MKERARHPDVERFLTLFRKVRDWTDDDPSNVESMAHDDKPFLTLCWDLDTVASRLSDALRLSRRRYAKTVGPDFISAWRDYEKRYRFHVGGAVWDDIFGDANIELGTETRTEAEIVGEEARELANAIGSAIEFAEENISDEWRDFDDSFREEVQKGIREWRRFTGGMGFDLGDVFRRRKLIPFVLVPRHISDKHGESELISLFSHLQQAHEAFIYGVPYAALALMRSILEVVLRDHYGATGDDLEAVINEATLPRGIEKARLHRLRKLANKILHVSRNQIDVPSNLEGEIINHLHLLRDLIEAAPRYPVKR